jgi:hypothetical protein
MYNQGVDKGEEEDRSRGIQSRRVKNGIEVMVSIFIAMKVFLIPRVPLELLTPEVDVDKRAVDEVDDDAEEDRDEILGEGLLQSV